VLLALSQPVGRGGEVFTNLGQETFRHGLIQRLKLLSMVSRARIYHHGVDTCLQAGRRWHRLAEDEAGTVNTKITLERR
jgi:hypothetical protein